MVNIGDVFILKYDEKDKRNRCVYYRKRYTISDLSKSKLTVFYKDNRTNYKCKCSKCSDRLAMDELTYYIFIKYNVSISIDSDKEIIRILKLTELGI